MHGSERTVVSMNDREKVLSAIMQNAEMGTTAIRSIYSQVKDPSLKNELRRQLNEYSDRANSVSRQISNLNLNCKRVSPAAKAMTAMTVKLKAASDNSTEHLAEMLVQGTNMGIIKINHALNSAQNISPKLTVQAKELLSKEQHYIDRLKTYL